ncbi:MAG: hypothetical protein IPH80_08500 [Myxococcales bacterium]|nr:hypothetical protein [Myxococcales bacterium]
MGQRELVARAGGIASAEQRAGQRGAAGRQARRLGHQPFEVGHQRGQLDRRGRARSTRGRRPAPRLVAQAVVDPIADHQRRDAHRGPRPARRPQRRAIRSARRGWLEDAPARERERAVPTSSVITGHSPMTPHGHWNGEPNCAIRLGRCSGTVPSKNTTAQPAGSRPASGRRRSCIATSTRTDRRADRGKWML